MSGKRYRKITATVDREHLYPLTEAVQKVKADVFAKFDETIEVAMNLSVDPRHADQIVRGVVLLPNGTGKTVRVGGVRPRRQGRGSDQGRRRSGGGRGPGEKSYGRGEINFDRCIATPDMMARGRQAG